MLALAMILDALFGEPEPVWRRVPHPVVAIGQLIARLEVRLNRGAGRRLKGVIALGALIASVLVIALALSHPVFRGVFEVIGTVILLAQRSLSDHVRAVAAALDRSLEDGRNAVARIVGRDPKSLDEAGVARAAIESAAENVSDGVVAPAFWFAVGGLPGIALYKAVNTADSMIGHRSERYAEFGWAAARLDDVLNWVPARLTGALICLTGGGWRAFRVMLRDASKHRSPNAGWPESAAAASLGVALAGPRAYGGALTDDPVLHAEGRREATAQDIRASAALIWKAWGMLLALALFGAALRPLW